MHGDHTVVDLPRATAVLPRHAGCMRPLFGMPRIVHNRDAVSRGIQAKRPFVGNGLWVTSIRDPDGYGLEFESPTDAPEESILPE